MGIDIVCLVVMAFAFYRGYQKGLIMAVFSVAAYIIGAFATLHLSFLVSDYLAASLNVAGAWLPLLAFALTFALVVVIVNLIGKVIEKMMTRVIPTSFNRFLGSLLYMVLALVLLSLLYDVASTGDVFTEELIGQSRFAPHLADFALQIRSSLGGVIPFIEQLFQEIDLYFEEAADTISA